MGIGPLPAFAGAWALMTAAMMLPSAVPFVFEFARSSERRHGWQLATALLAATYVSVWLAFGLVCFAAYAALRMPWPDQTVIGGIALVVAGAYALSPLKRACEARCRELCALHGPLPFDLRRSAVVAGARYGLSCVGCTAAVMIAAFLVGMSSLAWMAVLTALVLVYKLAPEPGPLRRALLAAALVVMGIVYAVAAA